MTTTCISQILATNLTNIMNVGGALDQDGKPKRIRSSELQRATGIARSTLRVLQKDGGKDSNPDLRTLCRIADELRIPVAFLLMDPQQWKTLINAVRDMPTMVEAAALLEEEQGIQGPLCAVKILRRVKVYPLKAPLGDSHTGDQDRHAELASENEQRRRQATIAAALMLSGARTREARKELTAFAASLANHGLAYIGRK